MEEITFVTVGQGAERRRWERIPITIPLFVRASGEGSRRFLEFGNVLNISAGGALLAVRQYLPSPCNISLEIPAAPVAEAAQLPPSSRILEARLLRVQPLDRCYLWAVRFQRPLLHRAGLARAVNRPLRRAKGVARPVAGPVDGARDLTR
ncbi:MAG: PilZ domain-containing protein [Terriglobales bacterium]